VRYLRILLAGALLVLMGWWESLPLHQSIIPDTDTLEPDPGWTIGEGRYADTEFDGYIYTVVSTYTYGDPAAESPDVDVLPLHVAFLDGETYFFFLCEPLE